MNLLNRVGLFTRSDLDTAIGRAFYVFSELSEDTVADQIVAFDEGTGRIQAMRDADAATILEVEAEIRRLEQAIEARREHMRQAEEVLGRRQEVRDMVSNVTASLTGYTLEPLDAQDEDMEEENND